MTTKWNTIANKLSKDIEYKEWGKLKKFFGPEKIDVLSLIEYQILRNYPRKTEMYYIVNRVSKNFGIKIPPQFGTWLIKEKNHVPLDVFVTTIKSMSDSHSIYAFICASLFFSKNFLFNISYCDNKNWYSNAPKWLKIILDRQYRLCDNSFLEPDDPIFFVHNYKQNNKKSISIEQYNLISSMIDKILGIDINTYIWQFNKFSGLSDDGIILIGSNPTIDNEIIAKRKRHLLSPVTVYSFLKNKRKIHTHGFCIKEIENGIYVVDSIDGKICVPFYLIDMPRIHIANAKEKPNIIQNKLFSMGYIAEEDKTKIFGLLSFSSYKVKNVKQ